jgi:hypothetical protein
MRLYIAHIRSVSRIYPLAKNFYADILICMAESEPAPTQDMKQYYVLGAVVLIAIVVAGYMLRPKSTGTTPTPTPAAAEQAAVPTPTPGPITKLGCDVQYFNQKIGFPEYYLSVEGGDVSAAKSVECTFSVMDKDKTVGSAKVTSPLTDKPERGGGTFRCTTKAVALTPGRPMLVNVALKDDLNATSTCSGAFTFPSP